MIGKVFLGLSTCLILAMVLTVMLNPSSDFWFFLGAIILALMVGGWLFLSVRRSTKSQWGKGLGWSSIIVGLLLFSLCTPVFADTWTLPVLTDRAFIVDVDETGFASVNLFFDFQALNATAAEIHVDYDNLFNGLRSGDVRVNATKLTLDGAVLWDKEFQQNQTVTGFSFQESISLGGSEAHEGSVLICGYGPADGFRGTLNIWVEYEFDPQPVDDNGNPNDRPFWWEGIGLNWLWALPFIGVGATALIYLKRRRARSA